MKRYLLGDKGTFYKANLHAHSTISDGLLSPEKLKELYKARGYSVLALSDHELLVDHSALNDNEFIILTAMEYAFLEKEDYAISRTIELNLYAKDPHNTTQVCYAPESVLHDPLGLKDKVHFVGAPFQKEYTIECIQKVIDAARDNGFLVSLNHPVNSMETPEFFGALNGLFAMEIYNHGSLVGDGVFEYSPTMYENMLRRGHRLYPIAADDCHTDSRDTSAHCDRYGGFVMINAPSLTYDNVITALEKGDFYASCGPEIKEIYIEDGLIHLTTSPAKFITMNTAHRPFGGCKAAKKDEYLTSVSFPVPENMPFIRFDVIDEHGKHANTRAYFTEELSAK